VSLDATIVFLEQRDTRINSIVGGQNTDNITVGAFGNLFSIAILFLEIQNAHVKP
jgi:hypothetical protein